MLSVFKVTVPGERHRWRWLPGHGHGEGRAEQHALDLHGHRAVLDERWWSDDAARHYTFTAGDGGIHTFTGVKLVTPGPRRDGVERREVRCASLTIKAAAATKLAFVQQPTATTKGSVIAPPVTVQVQDQFGNVTNSSASIVVALGTTRTAHPEWDEDAKRPSVAPRALPTCRSARSATGYTLTATSHGLRSRPARRSTSAARLPTKVVFTTQPPSVTRVRDADRRDRPGRDEQHRHDRQLDDDHAHPVCESRVRSRAPAKRAVRSVSAGVAIVLVLDASPERLHAHDLELGWADECHAAMPSTSSSDRQATHRDRTALGRRPDVQVTGITLTATDAGGNVVTTYAGIDHHLVRPVDFVRRKSADQPVARSLQQRCRARRPQRDRLFKAESATVTHAGSRFRGRRAITVVPAQRRSLLHEFIDDCSVGIGEHRKRTTLDIEGQHGRRVGELDRSRRRRRRFRLRTIAPSTLIPPSLSILAPTQ